MTYHHLEAQKFANLKAMTPVELADIGAKPADVERNLKMPAQDTGYTNFTGHSPNFRIFAFVPILLKGGLSTIKWCSGFIRALQYGRMQSVLNQMSVDHLDEIGISRSQIPEYARSLVYGEDR